MDLKNNKLLKEVRELLVEGKQSLAYEKKLIYEKNTSQFSIKIPKEIALASELKEGDKVKIMSRPNEEDLMKIKLPSFIIYGETKKSTK